MPGFTAATSKYSEYLEDALDSFRIDGRYGVNTLYENDNRSISSLQYNSYPVNTEVINGKRIWIEGQIYNNQDQALRSIINFCEGNSSIDSLSKTLRQTDGEFHIIVPTDDGVTVFSDVLTRLPLVYYRDSDGSILTRIPMLIPKIAPVGLDQMGLAQSLALNYPLGDRTLFEDVHRIPPAAIIRLTNHEFTIDQYYSWSFNDKNYTTKSRSQNASKLAKHFEKACERRATCSSENLILLSGGLDSRAVLGAFSNQGLPHQASTRNFIGYDSNSDVKIASTLAVNANSEYQIHVNDAPTGKDLFTHLLVGSGIDPFNIAHIHTYFRSLLSRHGNNSTWFTGDGGDKVLPDLTPVRNLDSIDELIQYILDVDGYFPIETVEKITGINRKKIIDELSRLLLSYPEESVALLYEHYQLMERASSWLFRAEDTNRWYCWTTSPFYSPEFFAYAMGCPPIQKRRYQLFSAFLEEVSPELAAVPNANFGAAPVSREHELRTGLYDLLRRYPRFFDIIKPLLKRLLGKKSKEDIDSVHIELLQMYENVTYDTNLVGFRDVLQEIESFSRNEQYHILTLLALDEFIASEQSTLMTFSDKEFR